MHSRELLSVPTLRVDCMCVYVVYMYVQYAFYICVCVYQSELLLDIIHALVCVCQSELLLDIIHALVCVYLSELLLGGSPPLSMYALEGAVECPHTQG